MFRKSKIEPVEKVKIVERYLAGEIGIQQAGKELGVDHHSIRNWISIYQYDGPTGLLNQPKNKSYSKDLKISAINDYLNGEGSLQDICTKYGIRSHRQLSDWIKVYNSGGILKTSTGGAYMKKAKNTTLDERLKIVNNPVPVSLLSGDRKPQIRFLGNHHSGSGNLYHKSFRM